MNTLQHSKQQLLDYAQSGTQILPYISNRTRYITSIDNIRYKIPANNIFFIKYIHDDIKEILHDDIVIIPKQTQPFLKNWVNKYLKPRNIRWIRS